MLHDWPFWLGGTALAVICITHWLAIRRMLGVSGRYTAIVNRLRFGEAEKETADDAALLQAMEAATLAAFGPEALAELKTASIPPNPDKPVFRDERGPQSLTAHLCFLICLVLGGFLAAALDGRFSFRLALRSEYLAQLAGGAVFSQGMVLLGGGILVGIGTRMAGGCTSGHGLCGTSRLQPGSLLNTVAFFVSGVVLSKLLFGALR